MRELTTNETSFIAGGIDTDGYNLSYIVSLSVLTAAAGGIFFGLDPVICATVAAGYATIMMIAKIGDAYFFNTQNAIYAEVQI